MTLSRPDRIYGFVALGGVLAGWWLVSKLGVVDPIFLPPPQIVGTAFLHELVSRRLWLDCVLTMMRFLLGFSVAAAIACPIGVAIGRSERVYWLLEPTIEVLRPIPSAAIIPIAILFLGIGNEMKVAVIAFGSLWPLLLNTVQGVRDVDPLLEDTGRSLGIRGRPFLWKIVLPSAGPSIATGARISIAVALILSVTVEMIAGNDGIGFRILDFERSFQYPSMYAGIVMLGIIGWIVNSLVTAVDRRVFFWARRPGSPEAV